MLSSVPENLKSVVDDLIKKITSNKRKSFSRSDVQQFYSLGENLFTCHSKPTSLSEVEGKLFSKLLVDGRDTDSVILKRLLNNLHSLPSVTRKAEILDFLYLLSKYNYRRKTDIRQNSGNNGSSGFYSDLTSHPSLQSKSKPPTPSAGSTIRPVDQPFHATGDHLIDLWGPPAGDTFKVPPVPSHKINRRVLGQHTKNSSVPKAPNRTTVPETDILRELLFVLSGGGGNLVKFKDSPDSFELVISPNISDSQKDAVQKIAICGWLHNAIQHWMRSAQSNRFGGVILQCFTTGLHEHMTEYYGLLARLESELNQEKHNFSDQLSHSDQIISDHAKYTDNFSGLLPGRADYHGGRNPSGGDTATTTTTTSSIYSRNTLALVATNQPLTLSRLIMWTTEPRLRLTLLLSLCNVCHGFKGGELASKVYAYTLHGDPDVQKIMGHLMSKVASGVLHFINQWIFNGYLDDAYQEFFVQANTGIKIDRLWYDKYTLRLNMLPKFITLSQAKKILVTGKSVSFLVHVCGEKDGIKKHEAIRRTRLTNAQPMYEQDLDPSFNQMLCTVYKLTSQYLVETLIKRYHFLDHLRATRQFLLLGQGDFIQHLMDLLDSSLNKPSSQIIFSRLSSILETAIRDTNAQYEQPEILQRLDVRLLDISSPQDTGWDIFSLDYHVDGPLATIFTDNCRFMYLFSFNFLWRAKRMEFTLCNLWKQQLCTTRLGNNLQIDLSVVLHLLQLFGAEIRHFIQQLQYYINFEVLECAWENLVKQVHAAEDLDSVVNAHQAFLSNVFTRCLLDAESRQLLGQLRAVFNSILDYSQLHQDFNITAMHENEKREKYKAEVQRCTKTGKWGTNRLQEEQESIRRKEFVDNKLAHLQAQIRIQAAAYRANVIKFIEMLLNHTDPSLRLLAEHMNFNGHYCNSAPGSSCATGSVTSGYPIPVAVEGGAGDGEGGYQQKAKSLPSSSIPPSSLQQPHEHQQQEVKNNAIRHSNVIILRSAMPYSGSVTSTSSLTVASRHQETPSCTSQASDITSSRKTSTGSSDDYKGGTVLIK